MSDRFDFLELSDEKPKQPPADQETLPTGTSLGWKPLRLKAVEVIGTPDATPQPFSAPLGLTADRLGALYVVDSNNHRIQRILGCNFWIYGKPGNGPGQLWGPSAVAVDGSGQFLFVAEQGNNRVQCLRVSGQHYVTYAGQTYGFRSPSGVAFDMEGMLWIADTGNSRVLRLDPRSGQIIGGMDRSVGIVQPISLACDMAHNIYVTDAATNDVTRYTYFGVRVHALGEIRRLSAPRQVAVDTQGRIYLAESGANRLHVFDAQGNSLIVFDTPSTQLGPMQSPSGVALGPNGEIYVADTLNNRVLRLEWA